MKITYPLTLRKMASFCSSGCLASRLVMLGGIHRLGALVAAAPWLETWGGLSSLKNMAKSVTTEEMKCFL